MAPLPANGPQRTRSTAAAGASPPAGPAAPPDDVHGGGPGADGIVVVPAADPFAGLDPRYRSPAVLRLLSRERPRARGLSHRIVAPVSILVGIVLVLTASDGREAVARAVFAFGSSAMFAASAVVHWKRWSPARYHRLIQLDYTAIFLCCAATAIATSLLALEGATSAALIGGMGLGTGAGIVFVWLPVHPPHGFMNALYLVVGWYPVLFLPAFVRNVGWGPTSLMIAGGLLYTVGAVVVGAQRPDPWPRTFGYHEVFHALVIGAVACHWWMVLVLR